ncbi:MAG: transcription factor [Clostridiaceae bacterium]|jgi:transcriptional regulator with XRE-family HTH domain|nr:transcription factor [Clostridiaceae bacterium]
MILLRKLRLSKGLSTVQLSKESGAERTAISNIENGHYKQVTPNMQKVADYFGIKDPLELTSRVPDDINTSKGCLNQRCLLNADCYCQSDQVCAGAYCQSESLVTDKRASFNYNSTAALFFN